ncbi:MAG: hypothetical protein EB127_12700 [Alphaproteobacteria bacterium]|nr:hypothetical protein [Alphaproteobacteria bacterium]
MPNLNEFLNKEEPKEINSTFENLSGLRPCSKCDIDVDGGLWDPENLIMKWTCSSGHETVHRIG